MKDCMSVKDYHERLRGCAYEMGSADIIILRSSGAMTAFLGTTRDQR